MRAFKDGEVWRALDDGTVDKELFHAAWSRLSNPRELPAARKRVRKPRLFTIEYRDGLVAHMFELNGAVNEWTAAWRARNDNHTASSLFWTQEGRPGMHFTWLLNGIEQMILTGTPTWPAERTLYTSAVTDGFLISLKSGQQLDTPYLTIPYRSDWRWQEPPPPPPMRPWSEQ